jgi:serine/threonine protein kinase
MERDMETPSKTELWDVFISHASEDKARVALPLAAELQQAGLRVWLDTHELTLGDSLRAKIDEGLSKSRFGAVILSEAFFAKDWPQRELNALVAVETKNHKILLPIRHGMNHQQIARYSPMLADKLSTTTEQGIQHVAVEIAKAIQQSREPTSDEAIPDSSTLPPYFLQPTALEGKRVGAYQLGEHLGSGGSGIVFRASHRELGDQLAIKLFYPLAPAYAHFNGLFDRGFRALSRLKHPSIVSTKDFGKADLQGLSVFYLVMDYITGQSLDGWSRSLDSKPDALVRRIQVAQRLTAAMLAAHETIYVDELGFEIHGVLHGDLKPSNILIGSSGIPIILDFLLVDVQRLLDPRVIPHWILHRTADLRLTAAFGTPGYMAPEQAEHGIVTTSTDIYGLGITLCYLFFPTHPSPQIALIVDNELPRFINDLLAAMTESDSRSRLKNMREVVQRLELGSRTTWLRKLISKPFTWLEERRK